MNYILLQIGDHQCVLNYNANQCLNDLVDQITEYEVRNMNAYSFIYENTVISKDAPLGTLLLNPDKLIRVSTTKFAFCVLDGVKKLFGYYTSYKILYLLRYALNAFDKSLNVNDFELKDDSKTYDVNDFVPLDGFADDHCFVLSRKQNMSTETESSGQQSPSAVLSVTVQYKKASKVFYLPSSVTAKGVITAASKAFEVNNADCRLLHDGEVVPSKTIISSFPTDKELFFDLTIPVITVELRRAGFDDPIIGNGMMSSTVKDVVEQLMVLISVSEKLEDYDIVNEENKKTINPKTLLGTINRNPLKLLLKNKKVEKKEKKNEDVPPKPEVALPKKTPKAPAKEKTITVNVQKSGAARCDTLKVSADAQVIDVLQQYLQVVEGDKYDEDDLDLYCLTRKDELDMLPNMNKLSQLKIGNKEILMAYMIEDLKELQEKQTTTRITILRDDDDDFELTLKDEETAKNAVEKALRHIKGDKFKADHCKLYVLVPEGDTRRYADDYPMKYCKRFNTLRFYLKKDRTLEVIDVNQRSSVASELISLRVKVNDKEFRLKMEDNVSVAVLKKRIVGYCMKNDIVFNKRNAVVVFKDGELDDDALLRDCGVRNNSVVVYTTKVVKKAKEMKVRMTFVNLANGKRMSTVMKDPVQDDVYEYMKEQLGEKQFFIIITQDGKRFGRKTVMEQAKMNMVVVPITHLMPPLLRLSGVVCEEIPDSVFDEGGEGRKKVLRNLKLLWRVEKESVKTVDPAEYLKVLAATDASNGFFSEVQDVQLTEKAESLQTVLEPVDGPVFKLVNQLIIPLGSVSKKELRDITSMLKSEELFPALKSVSMTKEGMKEESLDRLVEILDNREVKVFLNGKRQ